MRRFLAVFFLVVVAARGSANARSNYLYQVSPANAPLKVESPYHAKPPIYPKAAIQQHLSGSGLFILHIRRDGQVEGVETVTSTGHRLLDQEAIGKFRVWRFRPNSISKGARADPVSSIPVRGELAPRP